jgi:Ca2+-binding EF-hand superfamily protein
VQEDPDDEEDKQAREHRNQLDNHREEQPAIIEQRLLKLERHLKTKFANCYESVRKAFLALDTDYVGFITVEDILKYFGNEKELNYNDLKKLMKDKDSKGQGKIGYSDFSKWLGSAIHLSEGFYFRHDSMKNPQYDYNLER